ncbi:copper resistance CopC family protein [Agrococcus terreus]|uniref:CopC domain-containing protein n=1 Tax=Agrococcus terreus TaxID=574649 RepID=A0ABQ2KM36_9MICO|nr:copper resistance CopC family protein [Agrococcus terreus]GGN85352.1 hypothetical protein GCM10010968_17930 [Agrococcus terreus]
MQLALAAALVAVLLPAHASVIGSTPADGDALASQPGEVSVTMNEEILSVEGADSANAIVVTDAAGAFYGDGCASVDGDTISMPVELGEPGDYTLTYQVVSADGHPVDGTVAFSYEGEAGPAGLAEAPVCGQEAPAASSAAAEPAPPAATSDDGAATDEPADAQGEGQDEGGFPFLAVGIIALLAVLAVVAYAVNRGSRTRRRD